MSKSRNAWYRAVFALMACLMLVTTFSTYPLQTATAASNEYTSTVTATPGTITPGDTVALTAAISTTVTRNVLVDVEIIDAGGHQVLQKVFDQQNLTAGETKELPFTWTTPATLPAGQYRVSVGICAAGWGSGWYDWHVGAGTFTVGSGGGGTGGGGTPTLGFTATASTTPAAPKLGEQVEVTTTLQSSGDASGIVAVSLVDSANAEAFKQEFVDQSFTAGESKAFTVKWTIPNSALSGNYKVKVVVLNADRSQTLYTNAAVTAFAVSDLASSSHYTSVAVLPAGSHEVGTPLDFTAKVTSSEAATVLIDVEVYDPTGAKVHQAAFDNQSFAAGSTKEYPISWNIPADALSGTYKVIIGVFGPHWSGGVYDWNSFAGTFKVKTNVLQFTSNLNVSPNPVTLGGQATISATLTSNNPANALVSLRVLAPDGTAVASKEAADQAFAEDVPKGYTLDWAVPADAPSGTYHVDLTVWNADKTQALFTNSATQFSVNEVPVVREPSNLRTRTLTSLSDIEVGQPLTLTTEVTSDIAAPVLVNTIILSSTGQLVYQNAVDNVSLEAGVTKQIPMTWTVPLDLAAGDYKVQVGIFGLNWQGRTYAWNNTAGTFHVNLGLIPTITETTTASRDALTIGDTVELHTVLNSSDTVPAIVDLSLYDKAGNKVAGQRLDQESFTAGESREYVTRWTVPEHALNGNYRLVATVFNPDGIRVFYRNATAAQFAVSGGTDLVFTTTAATSSPTVMAGQSLNATVNLGATANSNVSAKISFIDVLTGKTAYTQTLANQALQPGVTKSVNIKWDLPKFIYTNETSFVLDGEYRIQVELYNADMSLLLQNAEAAGTFHVISPEIVPAPQPATPSTLPNRFTLGVAADRDTYGITGWMTDTGLPWDFAYHYLNGGVNTSENWKNWEWYSAGKFDGGYAYDYAKKATDRGYTPVFDYYQMLQSALPECGNNCNEDVKDLKSLNDPQLMRSYFEDFKLLMQLMGTGNYNGRQGIGKTVIVHVDPDLAGYAEQAVLDNRRCSGFCTGQGNNPAFLKAAVNATRMPELDGLPNTYQGYNWALLHLRDLYAPNVILAPHVNSWGTLQDVGSSKDPQLDVIALGQTAGEFVNQCGVRDVPPGIKPYDILFNDVADRDAEFVPRYWWDRLNITVPNFHRWEDFIRTAAQTANRKVLLWQVPLGNQYFRTMTVPKNLANGELNPDKKNHYMDNKIEYFFDHIEELMSSGIVGMMAGYGEVQQTAQFDYKKDGITNGPEIETDLGLSSGTIRIWRESTSTDDDGGYLRMRAADYYQHPILLP